MSQEYTEDKNIRLTKISSRRRIWEAILILMGIGAVFLMVSLLSFNPSDPSWSQTTWNEPIQNLGGNIGAWLADILFSAFGVLAYALPVVVVFGCWSSLRYQQNREYTDFFSLSLRTIGALALILTSCALADLNFDDIYNFSSGGVIGSLFSKALLPWFNVLGATLALLCVWAIGFTLFTGWSWVTITEKIGAVILGGLGFITNRGQNEAQYDEYEDEEEQDDVLEASKETFVEAPQITTQQGSESGSDAVQTEKFEDADDILFSAPSALELARQQDVAIPTPSQEENLPSFSAINTENDIEHMAQETMPSQAAQSVSTFNSEPQRATQQDEPEHYRFDIPEAFLKAQAQPESAQHQTYTDVNYPSQVQENKHTVAADNVPSIMPFDDEPSHQHAALQQEQNNFARKEPTFTLSPDSASVDSGSASFTQTAAALATTAVSTAIAQTSQVKQGLGPELPRPNPVRLPTRRELYGIHIPSQREAELRRREEAVQIEPEDDLADIQEQANFEQELRQQFMQQQRERYGDDEAEQSHEHNLEPKITANTFTTTETALPETHEQAHYASTYHQDDEQADDEDNEYEQQLAAQFRQQMQERYGDDIALDDDTESLPQVSTTTLPEHTVFEPTPVEPAFSSTPISTGYQPKIQHSFASTTSTPITPTLIDEDDEIENESVHLYPSSNAFMQVSPRDEEYDEDYTPSLGLQKKQSVFESISPIDDLIDDEPVEPLFIPVASEPVAQPVTPSARIEPTSNMTSHFAPAQQHQSQQYQPQQQPAPQQESLIHPFLMRNERPLTKPTTPMPSLDLLTTPPAEEEPVDMFELERIARLIEARLNDYRVKAKVVGISPGPVITRFELELAPGVKASRISNLSRDLARSLSAVAVRIVEVIPGKPYVGLELPNKKRQTVYMRELLDSEKFRDSHSPLTVVLGKDIGGQAVVANLAKMPHLLVAGTTGSGKSVGVNAMIISILYKAKPEDVRFIMIDPKMLELSVYEGIPHLLTEVVTDMKDAASALRWSVAEMERRYKLMSRLGVRNLAGYNEKILEAEAMGRPIPDPFWKPTDSMATTMPMLEKEPYIVVVVDEFADLMMTAGKKVEELIARLAQKARAAGIHLVLATQRPSVDIITGLIKANIPSRIAFTVSSKIDSRTILDQGGAESLLGMGDMLYAPNGSVPVRVHGAFVSDDEVHAVATDWKARGRPQYIEAITKCGEDGESTGGFDDGEELDPLFDQAVEFVIEKQRASISGVQRQFRIGYNRAARIIEQMEAQGIVSTPNHNNTRDVLAQSTDM